MRVLIVNYELDDTSPVLAWQGDVVCALAERSEQVVVLTQKLGAFEPPENVIVKLVPARPYGVPQRVGGRWLMNRDVARLCREYRVQACFVHMASDWAYILSPVFKAMKIPVMVWYAHGTVSTRLRLAHACADRIVTSTPEGFRLSSTKVAVIGQGVNTQIFDIPEYASERDTLLYIGRVSRRKRIDLLIDVMAAVREIAHQESIRLQIIGPTLTPDDEKYHQGIWEKIDRLGLRERVTMAGFIPRDALPVYYRRAFLHLNLSNTGSMDKTVVEALACGCPVLTSNEAFRGLLSVYPEFLLDEDDPQTIAERVLSIRRKLGAYSPDDLRALVLGQHDLETYADKVMAQLSELVGAR